MTQDELRQLVDEMLRDQQGVIESGARDRAIDMALARYDEEMPRRKSAHLTWQAEGVSQQLTDDWNRYCDLLHAEHGGRAVAAVVQRSAPPGREFVLVLPEAVRAGVQVFIIWACPHEAGSVHPAHRAAVAAYAAHLLAQQLAGYYSSERETAMGGDASRTESRARNWAARARELRALYFAGVGARDPMDAPQRPAAGAVASWPARNPRHRLGRRASGV